MIIRLATRHAYYIGSCMSWTHALHLKALTIVWNVKVVLFYYKNTWLFEVIWELFSIKHVQYEDQITLCFIQRTFLQVREYLKNTRLYEDHCSKYYNNDNNNNNNKYFY